MLEQGTGRDARREGGGKFAKEVSVIRSTYGENSTEGATMYYLSLGACADGRRFSVYGVTHLSGQAEGGKE